MKHTILFLFIGLCIASCHETDYPTFDDSVIDIYFTQDSVNYSFGVTPLSTTEHVVELPVRIIGASVKEVARNFKIEVVDKRTKMCIRDRSTGNNRPAGQIPGVNLIRLPEMYYIAAECLLRKNDPKAADYFNAVLESRGLVALDDRIPDVYKRQAYDISFTISDDTVIVSKK